MEFNKYFSYAKINLNLKIIKKREDWYHDIDSLFHKISLCDEIEFFDKSNWIEIISTWEFRKIPTNSSNTCYKAANILRSNFWIQKWICIKIKKNIPIQAWLWWWSSNAASVLKYLNSHWKINLVESELMKIWKLVWADVPFFISNHNSARIEWIWDIITKEKSLYSGKYIALFKPIYINIGTKWSYDQFDNNDRWITNSANDFECVIFKYFPDLQNVKRRFEKNWARVANMTWSWSSIFWIYDSEMQSHEAIANVNLEWWKWVFSLI